MFSNFLVNRTGSKKGKLSVISTQKAFFWNLFSEKFNVKEYLKQMIPYKHFTWIPRDVFVGLLTTLIQLKVYIINLFEKK